ncbi:MAG: T9SS type A sorting domain-containing protein [Bacteroidota bacterium]|nr:T9SS type A sorting domain-containing protein [Bacteroidota bacterium]MDX5404334.1 T9SS type A sorting domain-containing protein [Bacteroidota bacterium]MDX5428745.1 T9SS type A sorting domain-containing protein [Bacteroidota bacterium]MDX5506471.1 T9SS type A sorting domain-containing protein [Bacteroidota bacterium]
MKRITRSLLTLFAVVLGLSATGQTRFINKVFTKGQIMVESDVIYGINWQEYAPSSIGGPQLLPLQCDIYYPDTAVDYFKDRPVVVYLHTGSFLPKGLVSPMGDRKDSAAVTFCRELAMRGYVAVSASYRVGWLANSTNLDLRRGTNLLAVYKSIQDAKTAVRFLHKSVLVDGNPFQIDPDNVIILGQGSGGYTALAYGTVDKYGEVANIPRFQYQASGTGIVGKPVQAGDPYVDTAVVGDWDGYGGAVTLTGGTTPLGLPEVDTSADGRNFENYKGLPDDVLMTINLGGALGDSTWLEAGDIPMASVHCRFDFYAPYYKGMVQVPVGGTFFPVVEVAGSHTAIKKADQYGNNSIFVNANYQDAISVKARNNVYNLGNLEGILTFNIMPPNPNIPWEVNSNPWDFWDPNDPLGANETNPNNKAQSLAYIDTVLRYITPRMADVLAANGVAVGIDENAPITGLKMFPNPASDRVMIEVAGSENPIRKVTILDVTGRVIAEIETDRRQVEIDLMHIPAGLYMVRIDVDGKSNIRKLMVD